MKKRLISMFLAVVLCLSLMAIPVYAYTDVDENISEDTSAENVAPGDVANPQAEIVEWHYRMYNGKLQRRLWSCTYMKWLTDWEDCDMVE